MRLIVSGLVNIETTLRVDRFPIEYCPVRYPFDGVASSISGVGVNLSLALKKLGDEPVFLSIVGEDEEGGLVYPLLERSGISSDNVLRSMAQTARSVIIYDAEGRRMINVDLKDLQQKRYPDEAFLSAAEGAKAAVLCNINFNRELLFRARVRDLPVLTDVHVLSDPKDPYDADFMAAADVLFLSDERLWAPPREVAKELLGLYRARVVVVGMGSRGALLAERGSSPILVPAVVTRPIVSTIGAGDALFSAFAHFWLAGTRAPEALRKAAVFASWKIGERGAAQGFLSEAELELIIPDLPGHIENHP
jgi:ribokinase